jgi:hypothetical protein
MRTRVGLRAKGFERATLCGVFDQVTPPAAQARQAGFQGGLWWGIQKHANLPEHRGRRLAHTALPVAYRDDVNFKPLGYV